MTSLRPVWHRSLVLIALFVAAVDVNAESRLSGTVQERSTGAVISGARIAVINQSTNATRIFTTDSEGRFSTELSPGTYSVRVEVSGFKTLEQKGVKLEEGESQNLSLIVPTGEPAPAKKKPR